MKNNFLFRIFALVIITSLCYGCKKQTIPQNESLIATKNESNRLPHISNGHLVFENEPDLYSYLNTMKTKSKSERRSIENQIGFKSLLSEFEDLCELSEKSSETGYAMGWEKLKKQYAKIALFKDDGTFYINISRSTHSLIVNQDKVLEVGNELITLNNVNGIEPNTQNGSKVLAGVSSNLTYSVGVYPFSAGNQGAAVTSLWGKTYYYTVGGLQKYKLEIYTKVEQNLCIGGTSFLGVNFLDFYTETYTYKRGFLGFWYANSSYTKNVNGGAGVTRTPPGANTILMGTGPLQYNFNASYDLHYYWNDALTYPAAGQPLAQTWANASVEADYLFYTPDGTYFAKLGF